MKNFLTVLSISFSLSAAASAQTCLTTLFDGGNGGGAGWSVMFDASAVAPLTFSSMEVAVDPVAGTPVTFEVWTCSTTYLGNEVDATAWTMVAVDDGASVAAGAGFPTLVTFATPFTIPAGSSGIRVYSADAGPDYTNATATNSSYTDGTLSIDAGASITDIFSGTVFADRVWNGTLCYGGGGSFGSNYCTAAPNSTGTTGTMSASGSLVSSNDDLTLAASNLPPNQFGIFLASTTQAFVMGTNGTSNGNLCLGGAVGRFNAILSSGPAGQIDLAIGTQAIPQGNGTVAIMSGETWNFQAWHRDGVGLGSNLTDGLEVMFQ